MRAIGFIHQGFSYVSISDKEKYTKKMRREKKKLIIKNAAYSCFDRLLASTTMISFLSLIYWFQRKKRSWTSCPIGEKNNNNDEICRQLYTREQSSGFRWQEHVFLYFHHHPIPSPKQCWYNVKLSSNRNNRRCWLDYYHIQLMSQQKFTAGFLQGWMKNRVVIWVYMSK